LTALSIWFRRIRKLITVSSASLEVCRLPKVWGARRSVSPALLSFMLLSSGAPALAQSVAAGAALYVSANCAGCHGSPAAGTPNYRLASNNPKRIKDAIAGVYDATVGGQMSTTALRALTDQELMSLALYIGQVKAPMFKVADGDALLAMRVRSGASTPAIKNIYATLQNNGDGGAARDATTGWTATGNAAAGASHIGTGASMNYGVNYSAPAGTFGVQNFTATATNDAGSDARTVAVTVIGIDAPSAPLVGVKGLPYTTTNPLSTVSCNGCTANGFGGTSLPSGLTVQSDGKITGTATVRGVFAGPSVSGLTTGSTLPSDGAVSRTVQITLVGIDSGNPPTYNQGIAISTPYQVTATGTIVPGPNAYSLSPLPAGMTFDTASGRLAGTPSGTGAAVTVAANTTAGLTSEQITITVIAANAPTNVASTLPLSTVSAIGKKGDAILAAAGFTIAATSGTPVTYSSTELAAIGLEVDPTSGAITGTPNTSGDITVVLRASNIGGAGTPLSQTIRINPDTAPTVNLVTPPDGNVGTPFPTFSVAACHHRVCSGRWQQPAAGTVLEHWQRRNNRHANCQRYLQGPVYSHQCGGNQPAGGVEFQHQCECQTDDHFANLCHHGGRSRHHAHTGDGDQPGHYVLQGHGLANRPADRYRDWRHIWHADNPGNLSGKAVSR
jgi:mono/diheme cytochrome c family protein